MADWWSVSSRLIKVFLILKNFLSCTVISWIRFKIWKAQLIICTASNFSVFLRKQLTDRLDQLICWIYGPSKLRNCLLVVLLKSLWSTMECIQFNRLVPGRHLHAIVLERIHWFSLLRKVVWMRNNVTIVSDWIPWSNDRATF